MQKERHRRGYVWDRSGWAYWLLPLVRAGSNSANPLEQDIISIEARDRVEEFHLDILSRVKRVSREALSESEGYYQQFLSSLVPGW